MCGPEVFRQKNLETENENWQGKQEWLDFEENSHVHHRRRFPLIERVDKPKPGEARQCK